MYLPLALLAVSLEISTGWTWGAALVTIVSRLISFPDFYLAIPARAVGILIRAP